MENPLNNFDKSIKDAFEGFEAPYQESHWEDLQKELKIVSPSAINYFSGLTTGIAATGLVFMGMLYFFSDSDQNHGQAASQEPETIENIDSVGGRATANSNNGNTIDGLVDVSTATYPDNDMASSETEIQPSSLAESTSANTTQSNTQKTSSASKSPSAADANTAAKTETSNLKKGCTGLTIDFEASGSYGRDARYLWNFGDGFFSNEANPSHTFNKEGTFDVSLSVTSPATGQITSNVVQGMIEVVEAPIAQSQLEIKDAKGLVLLNRSFNALEAEWVIDGVTAGSKTSYYIGLEAADEILAQLVVYNKGGCTDTLSQNITIIEQNEKFPKAINTAEKQSFAPGKYIDQGNPVAFKVFDQANRPVFEGDANKGWDGAISGNTNHSGTYSWVMVVDSGKDSQVYTGRLIVR